MSVIGIFGVALIIVFACASLYWFAGARPNANYILFLTFAAFVVGMICIFNTPITEISFGKFGSIKTSVERASASADAVARVEAKVEGVAKAVDEKNVIAEKKLSAVEQTLQKASTAVANLNALEDFTSTVIAAQSDDRRAFDKLEKWAKDKSYRYQDRASQSWESILDAHAQLITTSYEMPWKDVDPKTITLSDLKKRYDQATELPLKIGLCEYLERLNDLSRKERLNFLAEILEREPSLTAAEYAGRAFTSIADLKIKPLAITYLLNWWRENKTYFE